MFHNVDGMTDKRERKVFQKYRNMCAMSFYFDKRPIIAKRLRAGKNENYAYEFQLKL